MKFLKLYTNADGSLVVPDTAILSVTFDEKTQMATFVFRKGEVAVRTPMGSGREADGASVPYTDIPRETWWILNGI